MVELISRVDGAADESPRVFYDRLCEGLCELTSMTRAGLLLHDDLRKLVLPAGSHGVEPWLLDQALRHAGGDAAGPDRAVGGPRGRGLRRPRAPDPRALRRAGRVHHADLHAGVGRRPLARRDLRRPRRRPVRPDRHRAPHDVDPWQDRRAGVQRAHGHHRARALAAADPARGHGARGARPRDAAAVRRVARAGLGHRAGPGRAHARGGRAPGRGGRPAHAAGTLARGPRDQARRQPARRAGPAGAPLRAPGRRELAGRARGARTSWRA